MTAIDIPPIARLKDKAREVARQYRKATGGDLQHARALDAVAAQYGFATWAALVATHGANDAGHANARKTPAVAADAVAYPSLQALLAGREPDAPLLLTLAALPDASPGAADETQTARDIAVFSDFRRGVQRYAAHRAPPAGGRRVAPSVRETGAFVAVERMLKPLRLPLQVASRQRVDAPLWPQPLPLTGPQGDDAASLRTWLAPAGVPLVAAEAGWLSEAARLLRPAQCWTFGRRDAMGRLSPMPGPQGTPLAFAGRQAVEAMIAWYAGELGGFEPMPLNTDSGPTDSGAVESGASESSAFTSAASGPGEPPARPETIAQRRPRS